MQTLDAIAARRQRRHFDATPIAEDALNTVLTAASRAPSARNGQRWDFVAVTDRDQLDELTHVWQGANWVNRSTATIALIVPTTQDLIEYGSIRFDVGQAAMLLMLAATDQGLASGQANCTDQPLVRSILRLPEDRECAILIALGKPVRGTLETTVAHARRGLGELVHKGHWSHPE